MKRMLAFLLLTMSLAFFQGCLSDGDSGKAPADSDVTPGGERKPRTPKVTYRIADSLVYVSIAGSKPGEENAYWIYRNSQLLEQPVYRKQDTVTGVYLLVDSVKTRGSYVYYVRYGSNLDSLSDKSAEYVFDYAGPSRSGRIAVSLTSDRQYAQLVLQASSAEAPDLARFERKVGNDGDIEKLDTIELHGGSAFQMVDTSFIADDAWVFYRALAWDADSEDWLPPTPWDSVLIRNKNWNFAPTVQIENRGAEVTALLSDFLPQATEGSYYLYRNGTSSRTGGTRVDSLPLAGSAGSMRDVPEDTGAWHYWVDAVDAHGRTSHRSVPVPIRFTGRPQGPSVTSLQTYASYIDIYFGSDAGAPYAILERTKDTASSEAIDTLTPAFTGSNRFADRPPTDGYWYYRIVSLFSDDSRSDPGAWRRSAYFRYAPTFTTLSVAIVNKGDRVEAAVERMMDWQSVLYRSKSPTGTDSIPVDTSGYSDADSRLSDTPDKGTWYYRVFRFPVNQGVGTAIGRSLLMRIDFTGNPVGPAITNLSVSTLYIGVTFTPDSEALAYILQRAADGSDEWSDVDTISSMDFAGFIQDNPEGNGYWKYRMRTIRADLTVTGPGAVMRTPVPFAYGPVYSNSLSINLSNTGARIECPEFASFSQVTYLMRSASPDWKDGKAVDTLAYPSSVNLLTDIPTKGSWYYWIQKESTPSSASASIQRSLPIKTEFTGAPEIKSLYKSGSTVQIGYPALATNDTLEIHRSSDKPDNLDGFVLIGTVVNPYFSSAYMDSGAKTGGTFYHYRLATRNNGVRSDLGGAKSIYFEAAP